MDNTPYRKNTQQSTNETDVNTKPGGSSFTQSIWFWIIIGVIIVVVAVGVWALIHSSAEKSRQLKAAEQAKAEAELALEQQAMQYDFEELNREFDQFESQRLQITNDSLKLALEEQYNTARMQVERLQRELSDTKSKSAAEIAKLKAEIESLRKLLKHYVEQINELQQQNQQLRDENEQFRQQNQQLQSQVQSTNQANQQMSQVIDRASKLNVNGLTLTPLNKKDKVEKSIKKAVKLQVSFNILKNVTASVGEKTFYIRICTPSGELLGGGGTFSFEGGSVAYSAKRVVEYAGDDKQVTIYYDCADNTLVSGTYTVEVFTEGYRVASQSFTEK